MDEMLQVTDLKKSYAGRPAVRGVSFYAAKGQMLALLGPNGAGKSTTINILCTSLVPDSGSVKINGLTLGAQDRSIRRQIGVVFQTGVLDDLLTVEENLFTRGRFYGLRGRVLAQRVQDTTELTGIDELLGRRYSRLSGGQRRRCDIARALLHLPRLLILDEPTAGLDPEMRAMLWKTVADIRSETGMTILMTTHDMEEAAAADQIVVLKEGKVAACGSPARLKERYAQDSLILFGSQSDTLSRIFARNGIFCRPLADGLEVPLSETRGALPLLELCCGRYSEFEVRRGSLNAAYLSVMKGGMLPV